MGRLKVIASAALILVLLGSMGFFLTKDSIVADHTSEETMLELKTNKEASKNTLEKNESVQLNALFRQYYAQKIQDEEFAESYENLAVYTLPANQTENYIAYVTYGMKIKDVNTILPGMESFYVEKTESGIYLIADLTSDQTRLQEVQKTSEMQDVSDLIQSVEDEYLQAKQDDPELEEALDDLQKAFY